MINTVKLIENYKKPTPGKWRKVGEAITGLGTIATALSAVYSSPYVTVASVILTWLGRTLTNFAS